MNTLNAYRFSIPLRQPIPIKEKTLSHREGVLIEQNGCWAEASPLPGFSHDTIDDVIAALRDERSHPPSLRFAISSIESPQPFPAAVPFNCLLLGDHQDVTTAVKVCLRQQCVAVKLKVGRLALEHDIQRTREVHRLLPRDVQIRLDANRAWSFEDAKQFAES
ncbi:MAG: enolase C-terminal domain-like protein, partial [Planctomycetota bacterium]